MGEVSGVEGAVVRLALLLPLAEVVAEVGVAVLGDLDRQSNSLSNGRWPLRS